MTSNKRKRKYVQPISKRYWPGKAPEWGKTEVHVDEDDDDGDILIMTRKTNRAVFFFRDDDDPRLRRLAESKIHDNFNEQVIRDAAYEIINSNIEEPVLLDLEEDDDDDALEGRRKRIKETFLQREQEEEAATMVTDLEEEESEYETCSEGEDQTPVAMLKPIFVIKSERDTIAERERLEAQDRARDELLKKRWEERKMETKQFMVEQIRKDEERIHGDIAAAAVDVETDDELNEAEECEAWKVREIARIKTNKDDREAMSKNKEECYDSVIIC